MSGELQPEEEKQMDWAVEQIKKSQCHKGNKTGLQDALEAARIALNIPPKSEINENGGYGENEYVCPIKQTKLFRQALDANLQDLKNATRKSRERSTAVTKLQEAIMWLGMDLKAINEESPESAPSPYPESYNPDSKVIEPTADNLKL